MGRGHRRRRCDVRESLVGATLSLWFEIGRRGWMCRGSECVCRCRNAALRKLSTRIRVGVENVVTLSVTATDIEASDTCPTSTEKTSSSLKTACRRN